MSVTIPSSLLHELIVLVENKLHSLDNAEAPVLQALQEIHEKARELARFERSEPSPAATSQCGPEFEAEAPLPQELDPPLSLDDEGGEAESLVPLPNNLNEETVEETRAATVRKRRKRVYRKISQVAAQENEDLNQSEERPNFSANRNLKYLTSELAKKANNEQRVKVYAEYLGCCRFNTRFDPESIIKFSEEDAETLGRWAASTLIDENIRPPQVLHKLDYAIDQKFQLTTQQIKEIGNLLLQADTVFKQSLEIPIRPTSKGRPTTLTIFETLSNGQYLATSEASLRETTYVAMTMSSFPILSFVNEPVSHLANPIVRPLAQILADILLESCCIPENIAVAYNYLSPYVTDASSITAAALSRPVPLDRLVPNDGDGIVELAVNSTQTYTLQNAVFHRLYAIDAPELFCTTFINVNGKIFKRHNGHLSHLALHFYLQRFCRPRGTALISKENPRFGTTPFDKYQRPLSIFWFAWYGAPTPSELSLLDEINKAIEGQQESVKSRLMSTFNPREAESAKPFLLSLNALLVLSGFCHTYTKYSPDSNLLKLQKVARENHHGSIWSGMKKNIVLGARQDEFSSCDESLQGINTFDRTKAEESGYPVKFISPSIIQPIRFHPWHERRCCNQLKQATRTQLKEHRNRLVTLPYGFVVDMKSDNSLQNKYMTVPTGEAFLQIRLSRVVGIAGCSTGNGVFTLQEIPEFTWITSYAPLAPVRTGRNHESSDYILKTRRNGKEVEIDGNLCPLGIGRIIQDGTFPYCLAQEKFAALIRSRVNCEIVDRDGEIWFRSTRTINAGEELLTRYSHDNSYWSLQFSRQQLQAIRNALLTAPDGSLIEADTIIRSLDLSVN